MGQRAVGLVGAQHGINSALLVRRALGLRPQLQLHAAREAGIGAPQSAQGTSFAETMPWLGGRFTDAQGVTWTQLRIPALLADPNYLDIAL